MIRHVEYSPVACDLVGSKKMRTAWKNKNEDIRAEFNNYSMIERTKEDKEKDVKHVKRMAYGCLWKHVFKY